MPIYEYRCPGHGVFTIWMTEYDPPSRAPCPRAMSGGKMNGEKCPYGRCEKVLSAVGGVVVKNGTGAGKGR